MAKKKKMVVRNYLARNPIMRKGGCHVVNNKQIRHTGSLNLKASVKSVYGI